VLAVVACAPQSYAPCAAQPGFDQEVRRPPAHLLSEPGPGIVEIRSPATRAEVLGTLRAIAAALREASNETPTMIRVDIPLAFFEGLTCEQILTPFDARDYCATNPSEAMISLYHLPGNWAGGGRELILHFDGDGRCDGARWCATQ
jgi:hypothetical protein